MLFASFLLYIQGQDNISQFCIAVLFIGLCLHTLQTIGRQLFTAFAGSQCHIYVCMCQQMALQICMSLLISLFLSFIDRNCLCLLIHGCLVVPSTSGNRRLSLNFHACFFTVIQHFTSLPWSLSMFQGEVDKELYSSFSWLVVEW